MYKSYAGIGSRRTPKEILDMIESYSIIMESLGYTLRSGGAIGADSAFEKKAVNKEIYIPLKGYKGHSSEYYTIPEKAFDLAKQYHPIWESNCN